MQGLKWVGLWMVDNVLAGLPGMRHHDGDGDCMSLDEDGYVLGMITLRAYVR